VTRSLGDSSMKEFVVGSPYTTETALSEEDEFLIVACDGLWDVCEDQEAVDLIRQNKLASNPQDLKRCQPMPLFTVLQARWAGCSPWPS
jgi:protein phosphatase PTC1